MAEKKQKDELTIQCPACEWQPDGKIHWACSCGHRWNTFDTRAKCPQCGIQWENTRCPGCGHSTPHKDWYKTKNEIASIENTGNQELRAKKKSLEARLISYGINNRRVSHLPYLDHSNEQFHSPYEAGCRMMILYAVAFLVHEPGHKPVIIEWLQEEKIWDKVSPKEKEFLQDPDPDEETRMNMSWRVEAALTLGWCLKKVTSLPRLDNNDNEKELEEFQENVPELSAPLQLFLSNLEYRELGEIYEETLLNELVTGYFRDLVILDREDETTINRFTSYERHFTLNWLRSFMGNDEWDDTDTST